MPELPHIVVPVLLYQAMLCALGSALSWHLLTCAQMFLKKAKN